MSEGYVCWTPGSSLRRWESCRCISHCSSGSLIPEVFYSFLVLSRFSTGLYFEGTLPFGEAHKSFISLFYVRNDETKSMRGLLIVRDLYLSGLAVLDRILRFGV